MSISESTSSCGCFSATGKEGIMTLINHSVTLTIVVLSIFRFVTALNRGRIVLNEFHEKGVIDCLQEVDLQCLKSRIVTNMYKLWNTKSLELMDSVKVKYDGDQRTPLDMTRAIVTNDWTDLLNRIPELIKHMSLEINVLPDSQLEEGRRKKFGFFHELVRKFFFFSLFLFYFIIYIIIVFL